jgi:hypothetical protein
MHLPDEPFHFDEISDLGISRRQLRDAVSQRVVRRVLHGVYCAARLPDEPALRAAAAKLVLPGHAVICDHSAAWLLGVDSCDPARQGTPLHLDVVSVGGHQPIRRSGITGGKRALLPDDVHLVHGVPCTTPLRTAADLACRRGRYAAMAVLDKFMREHGVTLAELDGVLPRFAGRRGVTQLRELATRATPLAESPGESWTRLAIEDAGLPAPEPQVWVILAGFGRVRLDLAYPRLKIAVEYDGEEFHTSDEDQRADALRRQTLRTAGWIVIVVRKDSFKGPTLDSWISELRTAVGERTPAQRPPFARAPRAPRRAR